MSTVTTSTPTYQPPPSAQCDLVMKGGITSGVVYPAAVMRLKDKYRFRSIGGASAGAIAAAFTAAAEFGRENGGFDRLDDLRKEIGRENVLRNLFRSDGPPGPVLDLLVALTTLPTPWARIKAMPGLFRKYFLGWIFLGAVTGLVLGLLFAWLCAMFFRAQWLSFHQFMTDLWYAASVLGLVGIGIGAIAGPLLRIALVVKGRLSSSGCFGLARGHISGDRQVLTEWLHQKIQHLAGPGPDGERKRPLTFRDLAGKRPPETVHGEQWGIHLRVMTSNLSHGQPYVFPQPKDGRTAFVFLADQLRELFPNEVVDYMVECDNHRLSQPGRSGRGPILLAAGYHFLPFSDDLPVLVATRMSLSFPVLLSAVPLYTIKPTAWRDFRSKKIDLIGADQLQPNWISDGGISSNFPIHFFDSFLPSRPTFGMNLNYLPESLKPADSDLVSCNAFSELDVDPGTGAAPVASGGDDQDVILPAADEHARPQWQPIKGVVGFVGAILNTMQSYRDNMQMMLPSYRERIVQIWLRKEEGGMNLAMSEQILKGIDSKGERAGALLETMDFRHHQWVRLRVLLAALEPQLRRMRNNFPDLQAYRDLLEAQQQAGDWYKSRGADWCEEAARRLNLLTILLADWGQLDPSFFDRDVDGTPAHFATDPPRPPAVLRVTPSV